MAPHRGSKSNSKPASKPNKRPNASRASKSVEIQDPGDVVTGRDLLPIHQQLLDAIRSAFPGLLSPAEVVDVLPAIVQEVKGYLYNREFEKAFARREYLEAYAVRWSASRALGYLHIFDNMFEQLSDSHDAEEKKSLLQEQDDLSANTMCRASAKVKRVVCLGGAAAELCALVGAFHLRFTKHSTVELTKDTPPFTNDLHLSVQLIDVADWSTVVAALTDTLTSPKPLSAYASATAKAANTPLLDPGSLTASFQRLDLLDMDEASLTIFRNVIRESDVVTIMFTLNELYGASLSKTQKLLLDLTDTICSGAVLMVVDSPGSYSTVTINDRDRKYPMNWLLDHTLLELAASAHHTTKDKITDTVDQISHTSSGGGVSSKEKRRPEVEATWKKLMSNDSEWFRLPPGLHYPLELENMRYQIHLYRRI